MRTPTGIRRLDDLLEGGVTEGGAALLAGPPFSGADVLARSFALTGLRMGVPLIVLLTDCTVSAYRRELLAMDPAYERFEAADLVQYIDLYSRAIGAEEDVAWANYIDGPVNLNGVAIALNEAERNVVGYHPAHRVVVDSVSTLMAYTNAATVFRFFQVTLGKLSMAGGTSLLSLQPGMHEESEVAMLKHLVDGVIELTQTGGANRLRVEGFDLMTNAGWIDYRFDQHAMDITGSFSAGRIR